MIRPKTPLMTPEMCMIHRFTHWIDVLNQKVGSTASWLVLFFTAVLGYEVVARYVFNAPTKWVFDISYMLGGSFFLLGEGYTLMKKQHVRIDIFSARFSPRTRAWIDIIGYLLFFFPLWGGLFYFLLPYVAFSWQMGERSMQGYWQPVIYPFKTVMPIGVACLLLQGLADFLRKVQICITGEPPDEY